MSKKLASNLTIAYPHWF